LQENQKIVLKKNSDSKTNVSSIKLCIQIKFKPEGKRKKNTTHVQYPERKLHKNKNKKPQHEKGNLFFLKPQDQQQQQQQHNSRTETRKKTSYRQKVLY